MFDICVCTQVSFVRLRDYNVVHRFCGIVIVFVRYKMDIRFERVCRACMTESAVALLPIWPAIDGELITSDDVVTSVATMFTTFTVFGASPEDGLPENICLTCISEMSQAYSFKQKCERSELTLRAFQRKMTHTENVIAGHSRSVTNIVSINSIATVTADIESNLTVFDKKPANQLSYLVQDQINDDHTKPIYQCLNCWITFDSGAEIESHLLNDLCAAAKCSPRTKMPNDDTDDKCNATMNDGIDDLQDNNYGVMVLVEGTHVDAKASSSKFVCSHCNASFAVQRSLTKHCNAQKCLTETLQCDICHRVFTTKRNIRRHMHRMHRFKKIRKNAAESEKHKCTECPKGFPKRSALRDHLRTHSGERPYLCSICGKGFGQNANLRQHMMRHSQSKPYQCTECPSAFVSKGELNSHSRKHTGAHPFVCDLCGNGFTTSGSMRKHRRIHTGERPYACEFCPLRFTALNTMKNHRRIHTGERPYRCDFCSRSFSQRSDCMSHMRIHTGDKPYACKICDAKFYKSCSLRTHAKKEHDITIESTLKRYPKHPERIL